MDGSTPFRPGGNTFTVPVTPGAAVGAVNAGVSIAAPGQGEVNYLFYNPHASVDAFIGFGPTSTAANAAAVVPIIGGSQPVLMVPHGLMKNYTLVAGLFFAGASVTGSCAVLCTPGWGV
jgi:hypothetical protein